MAFSQNEKTTAFLRFRCIFPDKSTAKFNKELEKLIVFA